MQIKKVTEKSEVCNLLSWASEIFKKMGQHESQTTSIVGEEFSNDNVHASPIKGFLMCAILSCPIVKCSLYSLIVGEDTLLELTSYLKPDSSLVCPFIHIYDLKSE